ncbi:outer membrane protein OmpK [Massilia sp. W12]|uniref:outer membrane protein OmpK n=1 Tax=Massilia sp. W12 TaxID=3126507 RepID=UPI0030CCA20B
MKLNKIALALVLAAGSNAALANNWSWSDVSINYLNWTDKTEKHTNAGVFGKKKDFVYLEIEGGMGGSWGDLYGFFDIENPTNNTEHKADTRSDRRYALKIVGRYNLTKLGDFPLMAYAHVYDFADNGFNDQNRVLGFGTDIKSGKLTISPWIGVHQESKSGVGVMTNGGMAGYNLLFPFEFSGNNFLLFQWHEMEFSRKDEYLVFGNNLAGQRPLSDLRTGQNGAIGINWNINKQFTTGLTYRYAKNKLGTAGYQDAWIFSAKYNF